MNQKEREIVNNRKNVISEVRVYLQWLQNSCEPGFEGIYLFDDHFTKHTVSNIESKQFYSFCIKLYNSPLIKIS